MTVPAYQASPIKRIRATKAEVEARREALLDIIDDGKPMTVRQVFYQATVRGLVEKAESRYAKVQTDLTVMRRAGISPTTGSPTTPAGNASRARSTASRKRSRRPPSSIASACGPTPISTSRSGWRRTRSRASSTRSPSMYDVPLMVARGYASLSFLYNAAEYINTLDVPAYIYHLGDFDPSGVNAGEKIEETLQELAPDAEIYFERIAVTPEQIERMGPADPPDQNLRHSLKRFWGYQRRA